MEAEIERESISQLVSLCGSSKDALKAIEVVRKGEGRISKEADRADHFESVLAMCQKLLQVSLSKYLKSYSNF